MQNYHKHTCYSNIFIADSVATYDDYAKRVKELGHKVISSVEHGWQSDYWVAYEAAKKNDLKFVFGAEAYWVRDRHEKDRSNHHIIILAKNENGRQAINDILSEANLTGYYYRPRVDLELLLSLPANDVLITSACIAFGDNENISAVDDVIEKLHNHFGNNFMLEIQYHNTDKQKTWNKHLLELSDKYGIEMIVGLDSHYIYPEDTEQRDYILAAKNVHYEDEQGWYMDYPDDNTVMDRFLEQGIFTKEQIQKAMDNTDICLEFDDYDDIPVFTKDVKLPTLYPELTIEERNNLYKRLITKKFKEYMKNIPEEEYEKYYEGVKNEVQTYVDTGMVDYPLLDYEIIKDGVEHGGLITDSGRGSGVSFLTNTLCGFSKVDRFKSAIKLYPERFMSKSRILETKSLPDIDMNLGTVEIFEESQKRVLGEDHAYPMIAFGTLKKKSAFKLYAKAKGMDFELANTISEQIGKFDKALSFADEDDKDDIKIEDFVDEQYHSYLEESKPYWGIVVDKKKAPSAYLLYQGSIRKEIGLIKCKSESTKKEVITTVMDGKVAESYKFLKNDLLKVDVVLLIDKVFKRIGVEHFDVTKLNELIEKDDKVWDLYAKGYTLCLNQMEKESTARKAMKYKPHNISELTALIAAIRPAFRSMYSKFESREPFDYGIPIFDKIIQTKQFPYSFILYQEQIMNTLNYAGFPIDKCYGILKDIAKKHPEKVKPLKAKFIEGFTDKIIEDGGVSKQEAEDMSKKVWQIVNDFCGYGFNCVSGSTKMRKSGRNGKFEPTVEEMYKIMNDCQYAKETGHWDLHKKYLTYGYGYALSMFDDKIIRQNKIVDIKPAGIRQTYEIMTATGKSIICTDNHKFPTPNGKKRLDELSVGDKVYCMGEYQHSKFDSSFTDGRTKRYRKGICTYLDKIVSITPVTTEMTYDVEMASPAHTFVSENGLVVSNSSHAYCMALDSLYQAWQKANYPYEFYEVMLQHYSDKGNKDKVSALKQEMLRAFGIQEGDYKFGLDNRKFVADEKNHVIYPSLLSIKGLSQKCSDDLYKLSQKQLFDNFYELLKALKKVKSLNSAKINTLVQIDYFKDFGTMGKIQRFIKCFDDLYERSQFPIDKIPSEYQKYVEQYSEKTEKQYRKFDYDKALTDIWNDLDNTDVSQSQKIKYEFNALGYVKTILSNLSPEYAFVQGYECKFKNPKLTLFRLCNGDIETVKVKRVQYDKMPISEGDIIRTIECSNEGKWHNEGKDENGKVIWIQDKNDKETILKRWTTVK